MIIGGNSAFRCETFPNVTNREGIPLMILYPCIKGVPDLKQRDSLLLESVNEIQKEHQASVIYALTDEEYKHFNSGEIEISFSSSKFELCAFVTSLFHGGSTEAFTESEEKAYSDFIIRIRDIAFSKVGDFDDCEEFLVNSRK